MDNVNTIDYEKKYKDALEIAKSFDLPEYKNIMASVFPELKESEDERIRKEIIEILKNENIEFPSSTIGAKAASWIAWLEKQGEQKKQVHFPKFTFDDILALQCCMETVKKVQEDKELYEQINLIHSKIYDAYWLGKTKGQSGKEYTQKFVKNAIKWLKSIRLHNTWKPSEEQMKYLLKYADQNTYDGTILTSLYNDLKRFK